MTTKVLGDVPSGCVLAFLEFGMGWVRAALHVMWARAFDRLAAEARP
ncbi:hypothetical protein [Deinococcus hopiensis]|nr:hypothetical protein [Deinococcus hopiensis]